jgi:pimeloyl-ACP methyl ester carboxylesterase
MLRRTLPYPSSHVTIRGLDIHYKSVGKGEPLILVHGSGSSSYTWRKNISYFGQFFRVYALDLPGSGKSQTPSMPISPSWLASFMSDFLNALGIQYAYLTGHSFGGMVALSTALEFPEKVKKLVLVNSAGLGDIGLSAKILIGVTQKLKQLVGNGNKLKYTGLKEEWYFMDRVHSLKVPVFIVWGENDPYLSVAQAIAMNKTVSGSQLKVFSKCHHAPHRERSDEFNGLVGRFLTS